MLTRHVQRVALVFGAILAAMLFFLGGAALRLLMGPISLGPFAGIIEDAINHSVSGVVVRFDQAVLEWSRDEGKVNLIVLGTKVFDLDGHIIAQAPKADLDFDAASLVQGHLNLKRFGLIGVQLTGVRSKDGMIRLGFGPGQNEPDLLQKIRDILNDSAAGGGSLDSFSIRNARIAFRDEPTGLFIISPDATFTLVNKPNEMDASLESAVEISGAPARLSATAVLRPDGSPDHGTLAIKGLSLPALTRGSTSFDALKPYQVVSDVTATYELGKGGEIVRVAFHVNGKGRVQTAFFKTPLDVSNFAADGSFDGGAIHLNLTGFDFASNPISASGKATLDLVLKDDALETVSGDVVTTKAQLNMPDWVPQPLNFSRLSVQASYDRKDRKITWQRAQLTAGALSADFTGTTRLSDRGSPALTLTGSVDAMNVGDVLTYWPADFASGAREWIVANVPQGRVGPVRVDADLPAGAFDAAALSDDALTVRFPFENLTARYIATMTPITAAQGEATLTGNSFHVVVATGSIGPLTLTGGDVMIPDLSTRGVMTRIKAHEEGKMSDVMRLIDEEPLGYPKRFGINPATVEGRAAIDLDFELPLLKEVALDQVRIGVQAKTTDLGLLLDKRKLEHGMVSFAIDSKSLTSQGSATLSGVPVNFKWTEDFSGTGNTTRVDVTGKLDQATRPNFGLSEPSWLTGTFPVSLSLVGRRFHFDDATLEVDMTNAAAELPVFNVAKKAGVASTATAKLHFGDGDALTVSDMAINGQGLSARGGFSFDAMGKLVNVSLSNLRSGLNDFAMDLQPLAGGGYSARIEGRTLDGSHFFGDKKKSANGQPAAETDSELQDPVSLSAKVNRLVFHDDVGFRDVTMSVSFARNEKLTGFNLDAMGTGKGRVTGKMNFVNGMRNLDLDTDDAGAFINSFVGLSSVRGGTLAARINFPVDVPGAAAAAKPLLPDYQGTITLSNVVITDQPFVARLFSAGSLDGSLRLLQGQGIPLTTFSMPFSARGKTVTIREGRAAGPAIGATFAGMLDRKAERIDVTGTLVPLYGLNSILGSVPILGDLLVSKKGEGIFGLTYAMKGNLDEPVLTVNPLSVLTPGIFRRIFEFDPPKEPPPETQPQASAVPAQNAAVPAVK